MSKFNLATLLVAILFVVLGVISGLPIFTGGSGVIFVVALVYSYTIAKREVALLARAINDGAAKAGEG